MNIFKETKQTVKKDLLQNKGSVSVLCKTCISLHTEDKVIYIL